MTEPAVGQVIDGRYEIETTIGRGGMGAVYRARHVFTNVRVALKLMTGTLDADGFRRFLAEARAASTIGHPAIVAVSDANRLPDGQLYLAMELLAGKPLRVVMGSPLSGDEIKRIGLELLDALVAAHGRGVVHRDLKPENIFLVAPTRAVKVLDFGIAKVMDAGFTTHGRMLGTLEYMAPEQLDDSSTVDARADLWAVGVILYEMVAGLRPFGGTTREEKFKALHDDEPMPIADVVDVQPAIAAFFDRALARDPARRFASSTEMMAALRQLPTAALDVRSGNAAATPATGGGSPTMATGDGWNQPASGGGGNPTLATGDGWNQPAPGGGDNPTMATGAASPASGTNWARTPAPMSPQTIGATASRSEWTHTPPPMTPTVGAPGPAPAAAPPRSRRGIAIGVLGVVAIAGAVTIGVVAGRGSGEPAGTITDANTTPVDRAVVADHANDTSGPARPARPELPHHILSSIAHCDRACKHLEKCSLALASCQRDCEQHAVDTACVDQAKGDCTRMAACYWKQICGRPIEAGDIGCRRASDCENEYESSRERCKLCWNGMAPDAALAAARMRVCFDNGRARDGDTSACKPFSVACLGDRR